MTTDQTLSSADAGLELSSSRFRSSNSPGNTVSRSRRSASHGKILRWLPAHSAPGDALHLALKNGLTPARVRAISPEVREHAVYLNHKFAPVGDLDLVRDFIRPLLNRAFPRLAGLDEEDSRQCARLIEAVFVTSREPLCSPLTEPLFHFLLNQMARRDTLCREDERHPLSLVRAMRRNAASLEIMGATLTATLVSANALVGQLLEGIIRVLWSISCDGRTTLANETLMSVALNEVSVRLPHGRTRPVICDVTVAGICVPAHSLALSLLAAANLGRRTTELIATLNLRRSPQRRFGYAVPLRECLHGFTVVELCRVVLEELIVSMADSEPGFGIPARLANLPS